MAFDGDGKDARAFPQARPTSARSRRDFLMGGLVVGSVALLLLLALPLVLSGRLMYGFSAYKQDLAASFAQGERGSSITLQLDGQVRGVSNGQAEHLFSLIVDIGPGKPQDALPEEGGLVLDFGDGSRLQIWEVQITDSGRVSDTGVLICYERADGTVYAYDTDRLQYESCLAALGA